VPGSTDLKATVRERKPLVVGQITRAAQNQVAGERLFVGGRDREACGLQHLRGGRCQRIGIEQANAKGREWGRLEVRREETFPPARLQQVDEFVGVWRLLESPFGGQGPAGNGAEERQGLRASMNSKECVVWRPQEERPVDIRSEARSGSELQARGRRMFSRHLRPVTDREPSWGDR
jgi:hypothetical protein